MRPEPQRDRLKGGALKENFRTWVWIQYEGWVRKGQRVIPRASEWDKQKGNTPEFPVWAGRQTGPWGGVEKGSCMDLEEWAPLGWSSDSLRDHLENL